MLEAHVMRLRQLRGRMLIDGYTRMVRRSAGRLLSTSSVSPYVTWRAETWPPVTAVFVALLVSQAFDTQLLGGGGPYQFGLDVAGSAAIPRTGVLRKGASPTPQPGGTYQIAPPGSLRPHAW